MTDPQQNPPFSLLWLDGTRPERRADAALADDVTLKRLVRALALAPQYEAHVRDLLLTLTTDPQIIAYRQAVLADLRRAPELVNRLHASLDAIITLESYLSSPQWNQNPLRQVAWRLSELERYLETVVALDDMLQEAGDAIQSAGLMQLRATLRDATQDDLFQKLQAELPELAAQIRNIRSITIGINLDPEMRPVSATLLDARTEPITGASMLSRIFGLGGERDRSGLGRLHNARSLSGVDDALVELDDRNSPFMPQLFKDLSDLLDETSQPVVRALRQYTQMNSRFLVALKLDIAFYLGAVELMATLQKAGLPLATPEILPADERESHLSGLYNINLGLQYAASKQRNPAEIVGNDLHFDDNGRIYILTGPNQGGKTTYTQAAGLAQLMFQAGLPVPAEQARLSPVDSIYTHFAAEERPNLEAGRLGEEARRLNDIFQRATRYSLVLLNESLASTSAGESLHLARDVVRALRLLGVRAIFATHLHPLADGADAMNAETEGDSRIISVVSQVNIDAGSANGEGVQRTYRIEPGPPMSKSYAIELAARYGISFEQLRDTLHQRDVLDKH